MTVQKIKQNLIRKAKVKKSYNKLKERQQVDSKANSNPYTFSEEVPAPSELHPDRQAMLDKPEFHPPTQNEIQHTSRQKRPSRPKSVPFRKEALLARQRREERERRQKEFEESQRQRQAKLEERERYRKAMARARSGGRDGQRKLGRESKVLLEKVQRMVVT